MTNLEYGGLPVAAVRLRLSLLPLPVVAADLLQLGDPELLDLKKYLEDIFVDNILKIF